jgi:hypothetical protein
MSSTLVDEELEKVKLITHNSSSDVPYGSTTEVETETDDDDDDFDESGGRKSFHLGSAASSKMNPSNVWTSTRNTKSFAEYGDEYEKVPSLLKENFMLVMDPNLDDSQHENSGSSPPRLYYAESAFYKLDTDPYYALTVNCDIYQRIFKEINDAKSVPCGLYFCCHGGDGAHTGVSHDDYVDIHVAYVLASSMFLIMFVLAFYDDV